MIDQIGDCDSKSLNSMLQGQTYLEKWIQTEV